MDIKRLRVGTKVKMLKGNNVPGVTNYYKAGDVLLLVNNTVFHNLDTIADRTGDYWAMSPHDPGSYLCFGKKDFKVLKY